MTALPTIIGLPPHLATIPDDIVDPLAPDRDQRAAAIEAWVLGIKRYRVERRRLVSQVPALIPIEHRYCSHPTTGILYWVLMYGWIFEPRPRKGEIPDRPFVLFPVQCKMLLWALNIIYTTTIEDDGAKADGVVSKARDMGATWCFCALVLWGFLFAYPWQARLVSWRGDEVDSHLPDSMFFKISYMLTRLPSWQYPQGFSWESNRLQNELTNPENGNAIGGQTSTERGGRGTRATMYVYDEAAINTRFAESWANVASSTDHRFAVSTEHLEYNTLFNRLTSSPDLADDETPQRFTIEYYQHPRHTEAWREGQRKRFASEPGKYEREILRDPRANSPTIVYPQSLKLRPEPLDYIPGAPMFVGLDPGYSDSFGIVWLQDDPVTGHLNVLNAYLNRKHTANFYGTILRGYPYLIPPSWQLDPLEAASAAATGEPPTDQWQRVGWNEQEGRYEWEYTEDELDLMAWVRSLPRPVAYYGDTSGNSIVGATKDTVYTELTKFDVLVNRDRTEDGKLTAFRKQARTYKGRQEATKEAFPRLHFNDTRGARICLRSFQEYRWTPTDDQKPRVTEPKTPLHDENSHLVTSLEYILVNRKIMLDVIAHNPKTRQARASRAMNMRMLAGRSSRMTVPIGRQS